MRLVRLRRKAAVLRRPLFHHMQMPHRFVVLLDTGNLEIGKNGDVASIRLRCDLQKVLAIGTHRNHPRMPLQQRHHCDDPLALGISPRRRRLSLCPQSGLEETDLPLRSRKGLSDRDGPSAYGVSLG